MPVSERQVELAAEALMTHPLCEAPPEMAENFRELARAVLAAALSDAQAPEPHAWAQWARVTLPHGAVERRELLTARLPFGPEDGDDGCKYEYLGEPEPLYAVPPADAQAPEAAQQRQRAARLTRCIVMAMGCLDPNDDNPDVRLAWFRLVDAIDGNEPRASLAAPPATGR